MGSRIRTSEIRPDAAILMGEVLRSEMLPRVGAYLCAAPEISLPAAASHTYLLDSIGRSLAAQFVFSR